MAPKRKFVKKNVKSLKKNKNDFKMLSCLERAESKVGYESCHYKTMTLSYIFMGEVTFAPIMVISNTTLFA
jgi:hypothetical protein